MNIFIREDWPLLPVVRVVVKLWMLRTFLCNCPLYDDARDLSNMSITLVNHIYMVLSVLCSRQSFYEFERFASRAFMRRKFLL